MNAKLQRPYKSITLREVFDKFAMLNNLTEQNDLSEWHLYCRPDGGGELWYGYWDYENRDTIQYYTWTSPSELLDVIEKAIQDNFKERPA